MSLLRDSCYRDIQYSGLRASAHQWESARRICSFYHHTLPKPDITFKDMEQFINAFPTFTHQGSRTHDELA